MFDMALNTLPSNRDCVWYYNTGDTRALLAQTSKPISNLTLKVTNNGFRAWFFTSVLLTALEHLERKIFRLLEIIPNIIDRGVLKNHRDGKFINVNFSLGSGLLRER